MQALGWGWILCSLCVSPFPSGHRGRAGQGHSPLPVRLWQAGFAPPFVPAVPALRCPSAVLGWAPGHGSTPPLFLSSPFGRHVPALAGCPPRAVGGCARSRTTVLGLKHGLALLSPPAACHPLAGTAAATPPGKHSPLPRHVACPLVQLTPLLWPRVGAGLQG